MAKHITQGRHFEYIQNVFILTVKEEEETKQYGIFVPIDLEVDFEVLRDLIKFTFPMDTVEIVEGELLEYKGSNQEVLDNYTHLNLDNGGIELIKQDKNIPTIVKDRIITRTEFINACILQRK